MTLYQYLSWPRPEFEVNYVNYLINAENYSNILGFCLYGDLDLVKRFFTSPHDKIREMIEIAILRSDLELLNFLQPYIDQGLIGYYLMLVTTLSVFQWFKEKIEVETKIIADRASSKLDLEILQWLDAIGGFKWRAQIGASEQAIRHNKKDVLSWLTEKNYLKFSESSYIFAVQADSTDLFDFVYQNSNLKIPERNLRPSSMKMALHLIEKYNLQLDLVQAGVSTGSVEILQYCLNNQIPITLNDINQMVVGSRLDAKIDLLKWAYQAGIELPPNLLKKACFLVLNNKIELISYLLSIGYQWSEVITRKMIRYTNVKSDQRREFLSWALNNGLPVDKKQREIIVDYIYQN